MSLAFIVNLVASLYGLILTLILAAASVLAARSTTQAVIALIFVPVIVYFVRRLQHLKHTLIPIPATQTSSLPVTASKPASTAIEGETLDAAEVDDINKRLFLKLIGSAGLATFIFALFKRDAQAAFFGSVPGPGTVAIKNKAGQQIDPAEAQPTDGYEVSQIDDTAIPAYYGFVNKNGAWYIAREGNSGEYRYVRGDSSFSTGWSTRAALVYDYFNNVF